MVCIQYRAMQFHGIRPQHYMVFYKAYLLLIKVNMVSLLESANCHDIWQRMLPSVFAFSQGAGHKNKNSCSTQLVLHVLPFLYKQLYVFECRLR